MPEASQNSITCVAPFIQKVVFFILITQAETVMRAMPRCRELVLG
jgi:hypothetical protein